MAVHSRPATAEEIRLRDLGGILALAGAVSRALEDGRITLAEAREILAAVSASGLVNLNPAILSKVEAFFPAASEILEAIEDGKFTVAEMCDAGIEVLKAVKSLAGDMQLPAPVAAGNPPAATDGEAPEAPADESPSSESPSSDSGFSL